MISQSVIYWFTRLDHIHASINDLDTAAMVFCVLSFMSIIILISIREICDCSSSEKMIISKILKYVICVFIPVLMFKVFIGCASIFIPTSKEMAAIYVIPRITNNEKLNNIGSEMIDLATDWMKELYPNKAIDNSSKNTK